MENNELKHYGILGMKWGVRRSEAQLRRARGPRKVTKEQYEAEKQKAINSGDANTVRRWKDKLSNKELQEAINRVDLTRKLSEAEGKSVKSGLDKAEAAMQTVGRITNMGNTALNAYGLIAKVNNTFNSKQLPSIDGTNASEKRAKEREKEAKETKIERDKTRLRNLLATGKTDEILNNYDSYEPEAMADILKVIGNRKVIKGYTP